MRSYGLHRTLGLIGLLVLSGCGILPDFLGEIESDPPLPGKRVSILAVDRGLAPDRGIADLEVRLPQPYTNSKWSQAGGSPTHAMYHLQLGETLERDWSADIGESSSDDRHILSQPIVVDGTVYTMDARSQVSAFDGTSGRPDRG